MRIVTSKGEQASSAILLNLNMRQVGWRIPFWRTMVQKSHDGKTWTHATQLVPGDIGGRGPVKNKPIVLQVSLEQEKSYQVHSLLPTSSDAVLILSLWF